MTGPIMKAGLWALGRPCSIGAFARTALNRCPPLEPKPRDNSFIRSNIGGDA
jgi:hypothetical protein